MSSPLAINAAPVTLSVRGSKAQARPPATKDQVTANKHEPLSARRAPDPRLGAPQVDKLLGDCAKQSRRAIEEAFQSVDPLNEGNVHTSEFERVVDHFFFPLSKDQHSQLLDRIGLNLDGTIDYDHFLAYLSNRVSPKKQNAAKKADRAMNRPLPQQLTEEQVEASVRNAVVNHGDKMLRAFKMHDRTGGLGRVRRDDFCQVLNSFVMVMTKEQFDRFWNAYDAEGDGFMNYTMFLERIGNTTGQSRTVTTSKGISARVDKSGLAKVGQKLLADPKAASLHRVEEELRAKMKKKCSELQVALREASPNGDGFVSVAQLRSLLDSTLMPIGGSMFEAIMLSVGMGRNNGTVPFEDFIRRFLANEDRAVLAEAVTEKVPGSEGHVVGPDKGMDLTTIMAVLRRDIPAGSAALLEKFINTDADRTGQVSSFELRTIFTLYGVHLPESGFRCLMEHLDPRGKGMIKYHDFLQYFAPKVEEGKTKWMDEVNNYNRARPAADMTFRQFKNMLQDKMRAKGKPISELFLEIDTNRDGLISPEELQAFLEDNYITSSTSNFQQLWTICDTNQDGMIQFGEFLASMGLEVSPGDVQGISERIHGGNKTAVANRLDDQRRRMNTIAAKSGEQAVMKFQEWQKAQRTLRQKADSGHVKHAFSAFDSDHDGLLSVDELAEMLLHLKIVEDGEILDLGLLNLGAKITVDNIAGMFDNNPYVVDKEQLKQDRPQVRASARPPAGTSLKKSNETPPLFRRESKKPAVAGGGGGGGTAKVTLSAAETADRLSEMIQLKFADMHSAFRKFDTNLDGFINRKEFQKVLVNYHFQLDREELQKLLNHIGMKAGDAMLRYEDFLDFFGAREGSDAHRFLVSTHRYNIAAPPKNMSADEAAQQLPMKVADAFRTVREAYQAVDQGGSGEVKRPGLKKLLERFNIPMTTVEFDKLWRRFDGNNDGSLQVEEFFASLGMEVTSTDTGASQHIADDSELAEKLHHESQETKMAAISEARHQATQRMPASEIGNEMKWKMGPSQVRLHQVARHADVNDDSVLSRTELLGILQQRGFDINLEKLERVLELLDLSQVDLIPYGDFMNAFADTKDVGMATSPSKDVALGSEFAVDEDINQFSKGPQSRSLSNGSVGRRPQAPTPSSKPQLQLSTCHERMGVSEFLPFVRQQALRQQVQLKEQLLRADRDQSGLVEARLLRSALTAHCGVKLTQRQVQMLVEHCMCGHRNKVSYNHFLDFFGIPVVVQTANKVTSYEASSSTTASRQSRNSTSPLARQSDDHLRLPPVQGAVGKDHSPRPHKMRPSKDVFSHDKATKLPIIQESPSQGMAQGKLQPILDSIRRRTRGKEKEVQRALKRMDPRRSGQVPAGQFRTMLKSFGVDLSANELFRLQDTYDTGKGSLQEACIDYQQFLTVCFG